MRSDTNKTGFKGVVQNEGGYKARCNTAACHHHHLGNFGTKEAAAQAYLQHRETNHAPAASSLDKRYALLFGATYVKLLRDLSEGARCELEDLLLSQPSKAYVQVENGGAGAGIVLLLFQDCTYNDDGHLKSFTLKRLDLDCHKPGI
jgi:hypothetical protein